jgi:hypothetical protein
MDKQARMEREAADRRLLRQSPFNLRIFWPVRRHDGR